MASALGPFDDPIFDTRFKKYKKVLSSSPLSTGTYVLETDSESDDIFPLAKSKKELESDIFLENRLKDFEDLNLGIESILRELGDSDADEGAGGLWAVSEPELVSSSDSEEGETPNVKIVAPPTKFKNLTKKRNNIDARINHNRNIGGGGSGLDTMKDSRKYLLDFDARGDSKEAPHFGAFSSIRDFQNKNDAGKDNQRQGQRKSVDGIGKTKTIAKTDANKSMSSCTNKKASEDNGSRKKSLPTRIKSAMGGFSFTKKKPGVTEEARQRQWV